MLWWSFSCSAHGGFLFLQEMEARLGSKSSFGEDEVAMSFGDRFPEYFVAVLEWLCTVWLSGRKFGRWLGDAREVVRGRSRQHCEDSSGWDAGMSYCGFSRSS